MRFDAIIILCASAQFYTPWYDYYFMRVSAILCKAIFVIGRLDTKGVGLKPWGRQRACSQDYPMALDPLLHWEQKPAHDFLFSFPI